MLLPLFLFVSLYFLLFFICSASSITLKRRTTLSQFDFNGIASWLSPFGMLGLPVAFLMGRYALYSLQDFCPGGALDFVKGPFWTYWGECVFFTFLNESWIPVAHMTHSSDSGLRVHTYSSLRRFSSCLKLWVSSLLGLSKLFFFPFLWPPRAWGLEEVYILGRISEHHQWPWVEECFL